MTRLTARQKFAEEKRVDVDGVLDIIDGLSFKPVRGMRSPTRPSQAIMFPAMTTSARVDEETISSMQQFEGREVLDVAWPFSHSVADINASGSYLYSLKSLTIKDARGLITKPMPKMFELTLSKWKSGMRSGEQYAVIFGMLPGRQPQVLSDFAGFELTGVHPVAFVPFVAGNQVSSEYNWHVVVGSVDGKSSVKLPCSPSVALDFLSLRDVPAGRQRRSALRHWVTGHTRKLSDEREVDVREHLRGRTYFKWDDLKGYVEPALHDLRKVGAA